MLGLIGYTGFVGGNLYRAAAFDRCYNSQNIADIEGEVFDLLVCAAPQAKKWWANQRPEEDKALIDGLINHLKKVSAKKFILTSTIDAFPVIVDADESFDCTSQPNHPYGQNRLFLEQFVAEHFPDTHIVRLPGLFGPGLKKNIIFDLIHNNQLENINPQSQFQWYNVADLWADLETIVNHNIHLIVLATEPIKTAEIHTKFFSDKRIGACATATARYDMHTRYAAVFDNSPPYIRSKSQVLEQIGKFIATEKEKQA